VVRPSVLDDSVAEIVPSSADSVEPLHDTNADTFTAHRRSIRA